MYILDSSYPNFKSCSNDIETCVVCTQFGFNEAERKGRRNSREVGIASAVLRGIDLAVIFFCKDV